MKITLMTCIVLNILLHDKIKYHTIDSFSIRNSTINFSVKYHTINVLSDITQLIFISQTCKKLQILNCGRCGSIYI